MKLKHTRFQLLLELICLLLLLAMFAFVSAKWQNLPEKIPAHFNAAGEIDRWGNKDELWFLPGISVFLYGLITAVTFLPAIWNIPGKIKEENIPAVYTCTKTMLIALKLEVILVFFTITYFMTIASPLPGWFTPFFLIFVFGTILCGVILTVRKGRQ
ncbi:MAG: DUF1648 domain-containing protein [Clostridiales bacterium]|jgi:uncharacterized membrane protein|nr:DUF1648 domain-containing protein [Clostridiales bacterium]